MKKIIFIVIAIFFLSGCGSTGKTDFDKNIYKGTEGIKLDFFEDKFPTEVFEGELIEYTVKAENKGPYNVNSAVFSISLEKGYMEFSTGSNNMFLALKPFAGKSLFNIFDDFQVVSLPINIKNIDGLSEYHDSVILTSFCYDYEGYGFADVCIDTDPHDTGTEKKACTAQDSISLSEGQGGPVAISNIDVRMLVDSLNGRQYIRPQFKIYIQNIGQGTVTKYGTTNQVCNSDSLTQDTYNEIDLVNVEFSGYSMSGGQIECIPTSISLRKEEDFLTCTLKNGIIDKSRSSYQTPLKIDIRYGYNEAFSRDIKIKKILRY